MVLRLFARPLWRTIIADEGPLEWLQFGILAPAAVFAVFGAVRLARQGRTWSAVGFGALSAALVFVAGEEIAWGQLVFGFETPESLAAANYKSEATLHNVRGLVSGFNIAKLVLGLYGLLGSLIVPRLAISRRFESVDLFVVPAFLSSAFLVAVVYRLIRFTPWGTAVPAGSGELEEVCLYFAALAFTWLVWRRTRHTT